MNSLELKIRIFVLGNWPRFYEKIFQRSITKFSEQKSSLQNMDGKVDPLVAKWLSNMRLVNIMEHKEIHS